MSETEKRGHWFFWTRYVDIHAKWRKEYSCSCCHCKCVVPEDKEPPEKCRICEAIMEGIEE